VGADDGTHPLTALRTDGGNVRASSRRLLLIGWLGTAACGDYLSGPGLSEDPNNILTVGSPTALYLGIQHSFGAQREGSAALYYMQQVAGLGRQGSQIDAYVLGTFDMATTYAGGGLLDIHKMEQLARRLNDSLYIGLAKVYEAIAVGYAASVLGDIPYREAADSTVPHPRYDPQLQVYADLQSQLDSAITIFLAAAGPTNTGSSADGGELIYRGRDPAALRAVYAAVGRSLKARYFMHVAAASASGVIGAPPAAYDSALKYAVQGLSSATDDFVWFHDGSANDRNGWLTLNELGDYVAPGAAIVEILKRRIAAGVEDQRRLSFYFLSASDGEYRGYRPTGAIVTTGAPIYDGSGPTYATLGEFLDPTVSDGSFGMPELTYAETQLIAAEATWHLHCATCSPTSVVPAAQPFVDAARMNRRYGSAAFGTAPGHLDASLQNIVEEKYLTLFLNPEIWNDWKRSCLPSLAPAPGATAIPGRLAYSDRGVNTPTVNSVGVPITSVSRNPTQTAACPPLNYTNSEPLGN
jgi:hypothetical protein